METLLSVDLGNSRCKLRLWRLERDARPLLLAGTDLASAPGLARELVHWAAQRDAPSYAAHSSVAARELERELEDVLERVCSRASLGAVDAGLQNACEEPHTVGRDRLLAARGALELVGASVLVLDAGTALTVDAVERTPEGGRFLGGAIAPGPALLAAALARGGARLVHVEPRGGVPALGRHTRAALRAGVFHGFRGAAAELLERLAEECGIDAATFALTGGAAPLLLEPPLWPRARVLHEPDLVHLGLCAAAQDGLGARAAGGAP